MRLVAAVQTLLHTTEALAKALEIKCTPEVALDDTTATGSISKSLRWDSPQLEISMSSLVQAANKLLEAQAQDLSTFVSELSSTISCITGLCTVVTRDHEAVRMQISQLEDALQKVEKERATVESQMKAELNRVLELRKEVEEFQAEKAEMVHRLSTVELNLREANDRVDALQEQVHSDDISGVSRLVSFVQIYKSCDLLFQFSYYRFHDLLPYY